MREHIVKMMKINLVIHPLIAGEILKAGFDEAVVAAGYLHDVVEDTDYTIEDISRLLVEMLPHL